MTLSCDQDVSYVPSEVVPCVHLDSVEQQELRQLGFIATIGTLMMVETFLTSASFAGATTREVPVLVHRKIGSKSCELVQRGTLFLAKEYAWIAIEGKESETYSPEMDMTDYLSGTGSGFANAARDAQKFGFVVKRESAVPLEVPVVRIIDVTTSCPNIPSATAEVEQAAAQRRKQIQAQTYKAGADGVMPPIALKEQAPTPGHSSIQGTAAGGKGRKLGGTVEMLLLIDITGDVQQSKIVRPLDPDLDRKAAEEVARWKFLPARKKGLPVPCVVPIFLTFDLH